MTVCRFLWPIESAVGGFTFPFLTKGSIMSEERTKLNESNGYAWRDLGDGVPVMVKVCPMCGVSPSAPDDCGMPTPECPNFGKDGCLC